MMNEAEKSLDPQLWLACAGGMAQIPPLNSRVYYFPQGHFEHAGKKFDFGKISRISPLIPCRVSSIKYMADSENDEVYAKIRLFPLGGNEVDVDVDVDDECGLLGIDKNEERDKPNSFAKTLTQSDANNGGGFSVPRYCAETIFPRLDYSAEPPVQTILAKDVHGEVWKFRHIYRGTPRRHLLTTGWSNFVNRKKLIAGDSVVFLRAENGELCIGVRRAKIGIGGRNDASCGWNVGFSVFSSENGNLSNKNLTNSNERGNVRAESVIEAISLAALGRPFEVVYYPRASTPEFVVRASVVTASMKVQWCPGMRFKMAFDTEDSSRISWFMGTISSIQFDDPIHWPNSPWRLLQVAWDEPDLLQNVKRVNPWLVELVSNIPSISLSPFSMARKRPRLPQPSDFPIIGQQLPVSTFVGTNSPLSPSSPFCCFSNNISSAGIQGARHAHTLLSNDSSHLHLNKLQPFDVKPLENSKFAPLSHSLKINKVKAPVFLLFGQPILTEQQIIAQSRPINSSSDGNRENVGNMSNGSSSAVIQNFPPEASSDEEFPRFKDRDLEFGIEKGHCKVFVESENVGRILDLTTLGSFEGLYGKLEAMFGLERSEISNNVVYSDASGTTKHTGDEPFCNFVMKARRLTILADSGSDNS